MKDVCKYNKVVMEGDNYKLSKVLWTFFILSLSYNFF